MLFDNLCITNFLAACFCQLLTKECWSLQLELYINLFFLPFLWIFLHVFEALIRYTHIYHYQMSIFVPGNIPCSETYFVWKYCFLPCIPFAFFYFRSICVFIFTVCYSVSELLCRILISVPQVTDALFISAFFSLFIQDSFYHCVLNLLIFSFI